MLEADCCTHNRKRIGDNQIGQLLLLQFRLCKHGDQDVELQ